MHKIDFLLGVFSGITFLAEPHTHTHTHIHYNGGSILDSGFRKD